jgi:hypothetical protein
MITVVHYCHYIYYYFTSDVDNRWSSDGCYLDARRSNITHAVCVCSHMTNFAILMDVFDIQVHNTIFLKVNINHKPFVL